MYRGEPELGLVKKAGHALTFAALCVAFDSCPCTARPPVRIKAGAEVFTALCSLISRCAVLGALAGSRRASDREMVRLEHQLGSPLSASFSSLRSCCFPQLSALPLRSSRCRMLQTTAHPASASMVCQMGHSRFAIRVHR